MTKKMPLMAQMSIIFLTWRRSLQKDLLPHKITLKQEYVLETLIKNDFLNPSQIAEMLFCDRPTATVIIKNMEREGWIRKEKDLENGKMINIYITEKGRQKLLEIQQEAAEGNKHKYDPTECLSNEERDQLDKLLRKIRKNIK
ncbi:MarR family transcriptional regulator [Clostridium sp. 19966]|uniref:MarR family winged helix-turn-helix transcriptional regulator n=1 Tax=Clostridium sp. 19966 TaxID=2768166 RepID=UPI0028E051C1|nr:MarR family transcriptional regulator [Clostridium sp. 19966]MDT8716910.1 MarR family transcriptional regulator [Clostridium sp. 19966]